MSSPKIAVYVVRIPGSPGSGFLVKEEALAEVALLVEEGTDPVTLQRKEMTEAEYEALEEFGGY